MLHIYWSTRFIQLYVELYEVLIVEFNLQLVLACLLYIYLNEYTRSTNSTIPHLSNPSLSVNHDQGMQSVQ